MRPVGRVDKSYSQDHDPQQEDSYNCRSCPKEQGGPTPAPILLPSLGVLHWVDESPQIFGFEDCRAYLQESKGAVRNTRS